MESEERRAQSIEHRAEAEERRAENREQRAKNKEHERVAQQTYDRIWQTAIVGSKTKRRTTTNKRFGVSHKSSFCLTN